MHATIADRRRQRKRRPTRRTVAAALIAIVLIASVGAAGESAGTARPTMTDPCSPSLARYVLAPPSRDVRPVSAQANPNGGQVDRPEALVSGGTTRLTRTPGSDPQVIVDFGKDVSGRLTIRTAGSTSPELRVAFSESLAFLGKDSDISWEEQHTYVWRPPSGASQLETGQVTFRYVLLYLTEDGSVDLSGIQLQFTPYLGTPATFAGCFDSSDEELNRIWYAGAYTVDLNTVEQGPATVILDGAKRDRAIWLGDLAVEARIAYLTHDQTAAVRDSLAELADHQRPDGSVPPTSFQGGEPILYDYCAWWVQTLADYYRYTGDRAFIERYYPNLRRQMDWFLTKTDAAGLLSRDQGIEWFWTTPRPGEITYLEAVYYQALLDAADLARALGYPQDATTWEARAVAVKEQTNARLFDAARGVYISHYGDTHVAQDGNVLSVLYGIAPPQTWNGILTYLKDYLWTPYGATTLDVPFGTNTYHDKRIWPFMGYFELQARFQAGDDRDALDLLRREWGHMLQTDPASTDWEWMTADGRIETGYASLAHGWSAGATAALSEWVLGVQPLAAGYARVGVVPHLGDLSWVSGRVPTPRGPVDVDWRRTAAGLQGTLRIPEGTAARVGVPTFGRPVVVTVDGRLAWVTNQSAGFGAASDGRYIYLEVGPGVHEIASSPA